MQTPVVFLLLLGIVLARGDTTPDKVNQLETKNVPQVANPPGLETASTRTGDLQIAHMQYQANRMENQDLKFQQHSQLQNSQPHIQNQAPQFYSQNQASQIHSQELNQQFHGQNLPQFQGQPEFRQFRQQSQNIAGSPHSVHSNEEISSLLQSQQRMTPTPISTIQSHSNEQIHDFAAQQRFSGEVRPDQEFYHDRRSNVDMQDPMNERRFDDSSRQQSQIISGVQSTEIRSGGFPPVFPQRSAFDNRQQPIVLPGVSQTHSTSVVVSGLKNLPVLPALVYSAAPVPSTQAVAYSRPWFQGGAYVKQHWQTPYARYVYSHIL